MSEFVGAKDLDYIVTHARKHSNNADWKVRRAAHFEQRAGELRLEASDELVGALNMDSEQLVEASRERKHPPYAYLQAMLALRALDPAMMTRSGNPIDTDSMLNNFNRLQDSTPVLDFNGDITGVLLGEPRNFEMAYPLPGRNTPQARFDIDLRLISDGEERVRSILVADSSLASGSIGVEGIARAIGRARHTPDISEINTMEYRLNLSGLTALRARIDDLYQLGMGPVDTTRLDQEIERAEQGLKSSQFSLGDFLRGEGKAFLNWLRQSAHN